MSKWILHLPEPIRARLEDVIVESHQAMVDDLRIVGRSLCGFEAVALRAIGARGELEEVWVTVDEERCMIVARAVEAPLPDTVILNGPLIRRSRSSNDDIDDVLSTLECWRDRISEPGAIGSLDRAARVRHDLSVLARAAVQQFHHDWQQVTVRSHGPGRHHLQLRLADGSGQSTPLDFVSGSNRTDIGRMSRRLVEEMDDIVGDDTHVSAWNMACPADRLSVTIGSTPFIDVGDPHDHMATMRCHAALPDGALLIPPSRRSE